MNPQSIAVYVPSLDGGGAERVAALLASGFHAAGVRTTLLVDDGDAAAANRPFVAEGVAVVVLGASHGRGVLRLARWLGDPGADVVLAVDAVASLKLVAARRLAPGARGSILLSYHGFFGVVRGRLGRAAYRLAPVLSRLSDRTICMSDSLARHMIEDWGVRPDRVGVAANPVPVERARAAASEADLLARPATILAMGRLVPEKGFDTLLAAMTRLPAAVRLAIVGEGPERASLERLAGAAGLAGRVTLGGYAAQPWDAYAGARVFALTSTSESFGNVVVEALASGLPVVATDCGGPREILDGGRHGALVPVGDVGALAEALRRAVAAPGDPAPRIARAAEFSVERAVAAYLDLFRAIPTARRHARPTLEGETSPC